MLEQPKKADVSANRAKNKPDREHYPRGEAAVEKIVLY
jgi:hypothetical protein